MEKTNWNRYKKEIYDVRERERKRGRERERKEDEETKETGEK
jgi:hypothetical protein